ncbi:WXG100 family type VII secretion target [Corynebacterium sp. SA-MJD20WY100]|uniref:WXG100 family type VII secretion target n=1 Tax=Corynebacterium sp. SA-MJD20WY100 TaxID=3142969 RepID=UPI00322170B4
MLLGRCTTKVDVSKTSTWEGDSAAAYAAAQDKWDRAAAELNTVLATISATVADSNDRMSDVNRRAAASWG